MNSHRFQTPSAAPMEEFRIGARPRTALRVSIAAALSFLVSVSAPSQARAGDILRGGQAAGTSGARAGAGGPGSAAATAASVNAKDALARTARAVSAMQAMQTAARLQAQRTGGNVGLTYQGRTLPAVPDGLVHGGLQVAPGVPANLAHPAAGDNSSLWVGAKLPTQVVAGGKTTVTIEQTDPRAVLTWETFNIGRNTTLNFDQRQGGARQSQWIAINKIEDPSGVPSQILGSMTATGQVYVINRNGILFGGGTTINTHALVASALPIDDGLVQRGLLNNPDAQFLFSALAQPAGSHGTPASVPSISDAPFTVSAASPSYTLAQSAAAGTTPTVTAGGGAIGRTTLSGTTDYTLATVGGKTVLNFTAAGLAKTNGAPVTVSYVSASKRTGDVVVQKGAILYSPSSQAHVGGKVALIGANVVNDGIIATPDGQTILAAGLQVGLAAHAKTDPSLRGLDVYVGQVTDPLSTLQPYAGTATNSGLISTPRADFTLAGKSVNQLGVVDSTTSVALNGRIDLLAQYNATPSIAFLKGNGFFPFFPQVNGTVILGSASASRILPELGSADTVVGTQLALPSLFNAEGRVIYFGANATLLAPNASLPAATTAVDATQQPLFAGISLSAQNGLSQTGAGGQVFLDRGVMIDVSGSANVAVPISENIVSVQLRGTELADSSLQRAGVVRGKTVQIDLRDFGVYNGQYWIGTPLADTLGYVGLVKRGVGELTVAGGTVSVRSSGSVVTQPDSLVNVSGGSIAYEGGMIQSTRLISNGQIIGIAQATPDRVYDAIYTGTFSEASPKYGFAQTFSNPLPLSGSHFEQGYQQGGNGGSVSIVAPSVALDGNLLGQTVSGPRQRTAATQPIAGAFSLTFPTRDSDQEYSSFSTSTLPAPEVVFESTAALSAVSGFVLDRQGAPAPLPTGRLTEVALSPALATTDGFGSITVNDYDGLIKIPETTTLSLKPLGSLTLVAANIDIRGKVSAPGGTLSFSVFDVSSTARVKAKGLPDADPMVPGIPPSVDPTRGHFVLGAGASLSVAGLLVDDRMSAPAPLTLPLVTNGGQISITTYSADLPAGSVLDVSGGAALGANGKTTYGNGGSISISTFQDPSGFSGGTLRLGATLRGFSGATGGALTIQAGMIEIRGTSALADSASTTLRLSPSFFSEGGFTRFSLTGVNGIDLAAGTQLIPVAENFLLVPDASAPDQPVLTPVVLPEAKRTGVSLSLQSGQGITMGSGASILTDPGATVSLKGKFVSLLGSIFAPAGNISVQGSSDSAGAGLPTNDPNVAKYQALPTVYLGSQTVLSTAGTTVLTADPRGYRTGSVLPGGSISIAGNLVAAAGSVLDVSGATDQLDLRPAFSSATAGIGAPARLNGSFAGYVLVPTRVDSNAGSITLAGGKELYTDARLVGAAGGPSALGGSLSVSSGIFTQPNTDTPPQSVLGPASTLVVTQSGLTIPTTFTATGVSAIGALVAGVLTSDALDLTKSERGHIAVSSFAAGGFDNIALTGRVQFVGPVSIAANRKLIVGTDGTIRANATVDLTAPYVALGAPFKSPRPFEQPLPSAAYGAGKLNVLASFVDVGDLSLLDIGALAVAAPGGEIRGDGTLEVAGNISLLAGQIYPSTATTFTIAAYDRNISVKSSTLGATAVTLASSKLPPGFHVGSSLLGSTVSKIEGATVTLAAGANATISTATAEVFAPGSGSVSILGAGSRELPLSAGGTLNIYASHLDQGGVLRAPLGSINLGWDGTTAAPVDPLTGQAFASTRTLSLTSGSITSVSAVDPVTGVNLTIPYGTVLNGTQWIDPTGNDITAGGIPGKTIHLAGARVAQQAGAVIDLQGGGDFFASQFFAGVGGTRDLLGATTRVWTVGTRYTTGDLVNFNGALWTARQPSTGLQPSVSPYWTQIPQSFAIIPGSQAPVAPYGQFSTNPTADGALNLGTDPGYVLPASISVGSQITLAGGGGVPAGTYTLLPARYALLPGAYLVTPQAAGSIPLANQAKPDGSSLVSGYVTNGFGSAGPGGAPLMASIEVTPQAVVLERAQYNLYSGNKFLADGATSHGAAVPRLAVDGGQLVFQAATGLSIHGTVQAGAAPGGLGGLVDISSPADIYIAGPGQRGPAGSLTLEAAELSSFGAGSLLIGGLRTFGSDGISVSVTARKIEVNNAGGALTGPDIILVARQSLILDQGAVIASSGNTSGGAESLLLHGDGVLVRASSDPSAQIVRSGVDPSDLTPSLTIGRGAQLSGGSLTLDSTSFTHLDPTAVLRAGSLNLDSGVIGLQLQTGSATIAGLALSPEALHALGGSAHALSLLSYSSIDIYGSGEVGSASLASLSLHTGEILGFDANGAAGGGDAIFTAGTILLDNRSNTTGATPGAPPVLAGSLTLSASTIRLGVNKVNIDQFRGVALNATNGLLFQGAGGLTTEGSLTASVPAITGARGANYTITAAGALTVASSHTTSLVQGGLGASLSLTGSSVTENSLIFLPSGTVTLHANGSNPTDDGVSVGGIISVTGMAEPFQDLLRYTDAGQVTLTSEHGSVELAAGSSVNVSAAPGGGNAGSLVINSPHGEFHPGGTLSGRAGSGGLGGAFVLDAASLPGGSVASLDSALTSGGFSKSISLRDRTDATVLVDGQVKTASFNLSADQGSIEVTKDGKIDASGATGGTIGLEASGNVTLDAGALLTVAGQDFDHAGKGGAVSVEAGAATADGQLGHGSVSILTGSMIDLSVASQTAGSAAAGHFAGTLHLRAPQTPGNTDLQIDPIQGTIAGASSIVVEGYQVFRRTDGSIDGAESDVMANGNTFAGNTGDLATAGSIVNRLLSGTPNAALAPVTVVVPGAEIVNPAGDLTLAANWDLSSYRFGTQAAPGVLTLRAAGNLVFNFGASLSDGFDPSHSPAAFAGSLWQAPLSTPSATLPTDVQSWSYRLVAGADLAAADFHPVQMAGLTGREGSLILGAGAPDLPTAPNGSRSSIIPTFFQTIRTGTGSIEISARGDVEILNPLATIYTAGTALQGNALSLDGTFTAPNLTYSNSKELGRIQGPFYPAQYSLAGGNIAIFAQNDVGHFRVDGASLLADSSLELPTNWLYRSGYIDPATGKFAPVFTNHPAVNPAASTSWWVDFSNYFEGVGTLGGGNVSLRAGRNVANLDVSAPTNARMPGHDASTLAPLAPDARQLVELGGGDLSVTAGANIDAGVYYVERGRGTLAAGGSIVTNQTRATLSQDPRFHRDVPSVWLPTTLLVGDASFDVRARGDLLLGPVANPFLLPQGLNNSFYQKTYFSTYAASDVIAVSSLAGTVTLKDATTSGAGSLAGWYEHVLSYFDNPGDPSQDSSSSAQPWLRLVENLATDPFTTAYGLMPPTLRVTSFSSDINLVGNLLLAPAPRGTLDLLAHGNLNGLQVTDVAGGTPTYFTSTITVSDADPSAIHGVGTPLGLLEPFRTFSPVSTSPLLLVEFDSHFRESGATQGPGVVLETEQALHKQGLLHVGDPNPLHLYTSSGNISGLTLFSGKAARIEAGLDVTDIALYVQNDNATDLSVFSAGRDLVAYDPSSTLRQTAGASLTAQPLAGDLQISGPGTLEVLTGRNLTLGNSSAAGDPPIDGTAVGLISVGNARNSSLPFTGADLVVASGLGTSGVVGGSLNLKSFIEQFVKSSAGDRYLAELSDQLGSSAGLTSTVTSSNFDSLPTAVQSTVALNVFFLALRDAGRDHNLPASTGGTAYQGGFDAIKALFPTAGKGDIDLTSREIKTTSGGSISILAPGGQLTVGVNAAGQQALDQGILTEDGGNISIFADGSVKVGTSRIFTLRGGNEIIWSSTGDIAAGASSKTVQSAPPTRVLVDPQSGDVQTDLAGLATGGGIGVLATVVGVNPGNVDLIAPKGAVDAGDAGIQATGNLNIAAVTVLNADNIATGGTSAGVPAVAPAATISVSALASPPPVNQTAQANDAANPNRNPPPPEEPLSIITVEVTGYGDGTDPNGGASDAPSGT